MNLLLFLSICSPDTLLDVLSFASGYVSDVRKRICPLYSIGRELLQFSCTGNCNEISVGRRVSV